MGILDFHYKNLLPAVWTPDGTDLTSRFKAQLNQQLHDRFPEAIGVYLAGDAVSHYWTPESDVDILVRTTDELLPTYLEEAQRASGYPLINTDNEVYYYPLAEDVAPEVVAKHFGPLYDVQLNQWFGIRVTDQTELTRPDGIIEYVNWRLFKLKGSDDPTPYQWDAVIAAFQAMTEGQRATVLDVLKYRIARIDHSIGVLLRDKDADTWKEADHLEIELWDEEELPKDVGDLPENIFYAVLNKHRYKDILDILEILDDNLRTRQQMLEKSKPKFAASDPEDKTIRSLQQRLSGIISMLIQRSGGYGAATDVVFDVFDDILTNNRYLANEIRRRRIVLQLYRKYYQKRG